MDIHLKHESSNFLIDLESSSLENSWMKEDIPLKKKPTKELNSKKNLKIGSKLVFIKELGDLSFEEDKLENLRDSLDLSKGIGAPQKSKNYLPKQVLFSKTPIKRIISEYSPQESNNMICGLNYFY
jgi:hypothetical protein